MFLLLPSPRPRRRAAPCSYPSACIASSTTTPALRNAFGLFRSLDLVFSFSKLNGGEEGEEEGAPLPPPLSSSSSPPSSLLFFFVLLPLASRPWIGARPQVRRPSSFGTLLFRARYSKRRRRGEAEEVERGGRRGQRQSGRGERKRAVAPARDEARPGAVPRRHWTRRS